MLPEKIYFDNNATTRISNRALNSMLKAYELPLNPSAIHFFGRIANKALNDARNNLRDLVGGSNYQVIFTSGGTESNNLALFGFPNYQILASKIEHSSVINPVLKKSGQFFEVDKNCLVNLDDLENKIKTVATKDFLVSVMMANNETGVIQPMKEIARLVHNYGGLIHADIVQTTGKIAIDLEDLNVDMASVSSHKFNGPQGCGALLIRNGIDLEPTILGSSQEKGKRAGSQNVAAIIGLGEACKEAKEKLSEYQNLANLRDYLEKSVKEIAKDDLTIFCSNVKRLPNTSFLSVKGIDGQTQLINLDLNNIMVSTGSACSSGNIKPSRTLKAMGIDEETAKNAIRISLGIQNNRGEIDQFIKVWKDIYNHQTKKFKK